MFTVNTSVLIDLSRIKLLQKTNDNCGIGKGQKADIIPADNSSRKSRLSNGPLGVKYNRGGEGRKVRRVHMYAHG